MGFISCRGGPPTKGACPGQAPLVSAPPRATDESHFLVNDCFSQLVNINNHSLTTISGSSVAGGGRAHKERLSWTGSSSGRAPPRALMNPIFGSMIEEQGGRGQAVMMLMMMVIALVMRVVMVMVMMMVSHVSCSLLPAPLPPSPCPPNCCYFQRFLSFLSKAPDGGQE